MTLRYYCTARTKTGNGDCGAPLFATEAIAARWIVERASFVGITPDDYFITDEESSSDTPWWPAGWVYNYTTHVATPVAVDSSVNTATVGGTANPKQAYGDKKLGVQYVPPALELGAAKALGEGAKKYGPYNWRHSKVEAMTYVGALRRHLGAYQDGEDVDPESPTGKLHIEGIAGCIAILLDAHYGGFLIDNRPPPGPAPKMVLTPKETNEH